MELNVKIQKKDGKLQDFNPQKIINAVAKSASRVGYEFSDDENQDVVDFVSKKIQRSGRDIVTVDQLHTFVEMALDTVHPQAAKSYRDFRNWKTGYLKDFDKMVKYSSSIRFLGDKENANKDSALVATKQALTRGEWGRILYTRTFLTEEEIQAHEDGYIYIHDTDFRMDTMNCCLFDIKNVLSGGFEMGNIWYNEPTTLDVAFDVIGDITLSAASQQYGGFTLPEIDKVLAPYAEKSYKKHYEKYCKRALEDFGVEADPEKADKAAWEETVLEARQGFQGWEYKFNTVGSSRGDYPFITISFGLSTDRFGKMLSIAALQERAKGQGKKGEKKPVLFPKLVFLYDEKLHGEGGVLEDVYEAGIACSQKAMYPDWLSLSGEGYIADIYKRYGLAISPMGCRAFLSPWYEKGGMFPYDDTDKPIFVGRFNMGAVSLNLPMILQKARTESKNFYDVLDYYLKLIRNLHKRTFEYLGEMRASTNPLAYCEGGFLGGHLKPEDKIKPLLKAATASFGVTALNELQELYNEKSLVEDGKFALEVMEYINAQLRIFKEEDEILYAVYGTPAESLCGKQIIKFRKKYGIIPKVSDREYVSNSFHCHVTEDITPTEKQDLEGRFWNLFNGGKIQYVRYRCDYNVNAIKTLIRRAMAKGFYEGVNMSLAYCEDCGHQQIDMDTCPCCGSSNLTKIDRMNGYLAYSRVGGHDGQGGQTRLNKAKMAEIADRNSM